MARGGSDSGVDCRPPIRAIEAPDIPAQKIDRLCRHDLTMIALDQSHITCARIVEFESAAYRLQNDTTSNSNG